jgi:hypothetical protein
VSLLVLAPSRDGFALVGDSYGTPEFSRESGPIDGPRKTHVAHSRVAVGICGASVLDYAAVVALVATTCASYDGAWNEDFLSTLEHELAAGLSRALTSYGDMRRASNLAEKEGPLSLLVLVESDDGPIAARYLAVPTPERVTVERDFTRALDGRAEVTMVGRTEYVVAHVLERPELLDEVIAFEGRRVRDVPFADTLALARLIHAQADMTDVPVGVIRDRFARIELPIGWIGGPLTGVFVGAGGARNLTDEELHTKKEQVMAGSTLLGGAVSAYTTYQKLTPPKK